MVNAVIEHVVPTPMVAEFNIRSVPDVPADPSTTWVVPSVLTTRNHVAVDAASPVVFAGSVGDSTAAAAATANGVPSVNSANSVVAAPPVAGRVPS